MEDGVFMAARFALFFGLPIACGIYQLVLLRREREARMQHAH